MTTTQPNRAKKFRVFLNGDENFQGKPFVLNCKRVPTWDSFLDSVTGHVRSREAVRQICTPTGGHKVLGLESLEDDRNYVAVGRGRFKKLGYLGFSEQQLAKKLHSPRNNYEQITPVEHARIRASGRIKRIPVDVMTIFVYANGKELEPAKRVTLTHKMLPSWPTILAQITERVSLNSGACRKLYTLDGRVICSPSELKSFCQYVAVGADVGGFKHLNYGANKPAFNSSPKRDRRRLEPLTVQRRRATHTTTSGSQQTGTTIENSLTSTGSSDRASGEQMQLQQRKAPPPTIPRLHRKPIKQPAKKEEDEVFHAKPVKYKRPSDKQRPVDYDKDEGGVFKAKGKNRETSGAQEVDETRETHVDLPIDQVEAEEVKDEEIETETNNNNTKVISKQSKQQPKKQKPKNNAKSRQHVPTPKSTHDTESPHIDTESPKPSPHPPNGFRSATPVSMNRTPTPRSRTPTPKSLTPEQLEKEKSHSPTPPPKSQTPPRSATPNERRSLTPAERPRSLTPLARSTTPLPRSETPKPERSESGRSESRSKTPDSRSQKSPVSEHAEDDAASDRDENDAAAATKIQANFKGYQARKEYAKSKQSASEVKEE